MKSTLQWNVIVPATILSLAMVVPVFGQTNPSGTDSMNAAGHSMKEAGSDTADATKHAYVGTATALRDTRSRPELRVPFIRRAPASIPRFTSALPPVCNAYRAGSFERGRSASRAGHAMDRRRA